MSLSTLELVSTGVLALLTESTNTIQAQSVVPDESAPLESHRLTLDLGWRTQRTASDVLTDLLDIDGIRVVAERRLWDRPDILTLRHDFGWNTPLHLYCAAGIDRAVYFDTQPSVRLFGMRQQRSVGAMAEVGASWRLTGQLDMESDIRWMDLTRDAGLMRTDAEWVSGDAAMTLSLVWRGR
jgi:hypothetical protein